MENVEEEFGALQHHLLEVGGVVMQVLVCTDGIQGRVVVGVEASPLEGGLDILVEGPKDNLGGIEGGVLERAEHIIGPKHHAIVDRYDNKSVVECVVLQELPGVLVDVRHTRRRGFDGLRHGHIQGNGNDSKRKGQGQQMPAHC